MKAISVTRFLFSCCLLLAAGPSLHGHTFTNPDGKTFEGEILGGNENTVTIKRTSDNKTFTIERKRLSEADQSEVTEWLEDNPTVRLSFKTVKKSAQPDAEEAKPSTDYYEIEVRNETAQATPPLTLRYMQRCVTRGDKHAGLAPFHNDFAEKTIHLTPIPPFKSIVVNSDPVGVRKTVYGGRQVTRQSDGRTQFKDTFLESRKILNGISLVVFHDSRNVGQHALAGMEKQTALLLRKAADPTSSKGSSSGRLQRGPSRRE